MKQVYKLLAVLALTGFAVLGLAQNTLGGTSISNTATATFTDSGGTTRDSTSNTVTTTVQTVYSFNIEPDDGLNPVVTPTFVNPTSNSNTAAAAATTTFNYTVVNQTNNGLADTLPVTLTAVQDTTDNFNLSNVIITVYNFTDVSGDGLYTPGTDTLGTAVATSTADNPVTFNFPASGQGTKYAVVVTGVLPADGAVNGGQAARIDLRATNDDAVTAGFDITTQTNENISFENRNFARVTVLERNVLGVAKNLQSVVNNGNGTYDVTYRMTLENFGNVTLSNVQIVENFATTFTSPATYAFQSMTVVSGTVATNAGFTGTTPNTNMLNAATSTLARQATAQVDVVVRVTPGTNLTGPYNNQVTASGQSPLGVTANDTSTNGTDPDVDGDNGNGSTDNDNNPNETSVTPVTFTEDRGLGLAKTFSAPTVVSPGVFETTLTFNIKNLSDATNGVRLSNVQIVDNLNLTFKSPATYTVQSKTVSAVSVGSAAAINAGYNGNTDQNLLASGTLLRQGTATVTVVVRFTPNGATGPFVNQATATGTTPAGTVLTDLSDNGTNPDQDNDGWGNEQTTAYDANRDGSITPATEGQVADPNSNGSNNTTTDENDPTPITFTEVPLLGVAKNLDSITALTGANRGQFDAVFTVTVENMGNVNLNSLQVTDNLGTTFAAPASIISVSGITSAALAENTGFNGVGNQNLLLATDTLAPGATATVSFTVRFNPGGRTNITNAATGTATSPGGTSVNDTSTDGLDPDGTDNDGNPDESTPTPVTIPETPELGVAMGAATPVNNGDGTYTVTYTVTVENLGNVPLSNLQVPFPLTTGGGTNFTALQVESATVSGTTGGLTANGTYTGEGVNNLLSGTNSLAVGASGTITVSVVVRPGAGLGPYTHNVTGTATSPAGPAGNVTDVSTNGADTDTDTAGVGVANNFEANDDSVPTPVSFTENPRLGIAKAASAATAVTSGTPAYPTGEFTTTLTFTFENLGDVPLSSVQGTDNLNAVFGAGNYTVTGTGGTGVNASFNGNTDTNLLAAAQSLAVGATRTVTVIVRFNPNGSASPINNTATATSTSPSGATVNDNSTNGLDPDVDAVASDGTTPDGGTGANDGDNNANNNTSPTPIPFTESPVIAVAKAMTLLNANLDSNDATPGPFSIRFDYTLKNIGNVALNTVTLTEDLAGQLGGASNYSITSVPSLTTTPPAPSTLNLNNPAFNGNTNTAVLAAASTLAIGHTAVISVTITINTPGAYTNQVTATASGPGGRTSTTDTSDNGTNPDPDGDGNPNETAGGCAAAPTGPNCENDPTPLNLDALQLIKSARVCSDATCTTVTDATGASVKPGQYIEYTIVAKNLGGQPVSAVVVTDPIPTPTRYMTSSNATAGITCSTAGVGGPFAACPATTATGSTTVTHARFAAVSLTANDAAVGGTDETTVKFVVYVP